MRLHLRSDVTVGSCLSGGLDSSSIVAIAGEQMPHGARLETVSACYPGESVDERRYVDAVIRKTGMGLHVVEPRAEDVMSLAEDINWHQDEPFGSTSIIAQWLVFSTARDAGIKVMLDGQGADEQLAGYHFGFPQHLLGLLRRGDIRLFFETLGKRSSIHGVPVADQLLRLASALLPRGLGESLRRGRLDWLDGPAIREKGNHEGALAAACASSGMRWPTDLASMCDVMVHASNLPMLLHWEDRSSMAHSIEARVPFLDGPLVDFSLSLGNAHKTVGVETKRVLRRAMRDLVPALVLDRQDKIGFATPEQRWFRGELSGFLKDEITAALTLYPELFDAKRLAALRDGLTTGETPADPLLWRIANLAIWGRKFNVSLA